MSVNLEEMIDFVQRMVENGKQYIYMLYLIYDVSLYFIVSNVAYHWQFNYLIISSCASLFETIELEV